MFVVGLELGRILVDSFHAAVCCGVARTPVDSFYTAVIERLTTSFDQSWNSSDIPCYHFMLYSAIIGMHCCLSFRLYNHIQKASKLPSGCDYSVFKVCLSLTNLYWCVIDTLSCYVGESDYWPAP